MFADRKATMMIPVRDLARARAWYADKLGIVPAREVEYGSYYALSGVDAFMYPTEFAGTSQATLFAFACDDLLADMAEMRRRGVVFEEYDLPDMKTENGVVSFGAAKNAWAKDSEGNILGFVEGM
jgi:catechol 2,3-dioxygenase-like lactoylglutathione lyase family enzyme